MRRAGQLVLFVLSSLITFELIARVVLGNGYLLARIAGNNDASWRSSWLQRYKKDAPFELLFDEYDALLGWRTKKNIRDGKTGERKLTTNSKGIRSLKEYSYEKTPNTIRIVLLGDSFTFGEEVTDEEVYASRLEHLLPNTEVINMAVHGYGTDQMLLLLQHEGVMYAPDIVLLGFIYDDIDRNILSFRDFAKPTYRIIDGRLTLTNVPVPSPVDVHKRERYRLGAVDVATILYDNYLWMSGEKSREVDVVTTAILKELIETTKRIGAQPIFVYLPTARESVDESPQTRGERFFDTFCKTADVACENVRPLFTQARSQGKTLKPFGHWDALGHELVAQGISQFFRDRVLKE